MMVEHPECPRCHQPFVADKQRVYCDTCKRAIHSEVVCRSRRKCGRRRSQGTPEQRLRWRLARKLRKHDMTVSDHTQLLAAQGGVCAICGGPPSGRSKTRFHIDHDHVTGAVRGLLCHHCNVGLGYFRDQPALLQRAIAYLQGRNSEAPQDVAA